MALLVGTILALINHGEKMISLSLNMQSIFQIVLTYLVPYSVSTWSAVRAIEATTPGRRGEPAEKTSGDSDNEKDTNTAHPEPWTYTMRLVRRSGRGVLLIAAAAILLGVFNLLLKRYIDGALCILAGLGALLIWIVKRRF